ncbi:MAG: 3-oxoacyl-[acyl-carrier-protein] synthase [Bacteroidota bacterium]|nr:3-oxoacyl-[acyl-carrier-protein] synthase [Bacteroidota bacterium]
MNAYIKAIASYLPERLVDNNSIVDAFPDWSSDKVVTKLGIKQRHIADVNEFSSDMAVKAAEKLFEKFSIKPDEIDFVILCTQSPDYLLPTTACVIQNRLKIPTSAGALDFNLGCSGYVYGLSLAKGLIYAGIAKNILFLTAETYSKFLHPKDKSNISIFGDGATATVVSEEGYAEIMNFSLGSDGSGFENLIVKSGGVRHSQRLNDLHFDEKDNPISSDYLYMNGSEIFNFTLENVPILVQNTLFKNDLNMDNIDYFVFHQANNYLLGFLRKKMKIPQDKFLHYIENVGNTVSSTIPLALENYINDNTLKGNVLLAGFGVGYSWGGTILKF